MSRGVDVAPAPEKNPGRTSFDLDQKQAKVLAKFKPGDVVEVRVIVKITDLSLREPYEAVDAKYVGHFSGEIDDISLAKSDKNIFAEFAKDDMSQ